MYIIKKKYPTGNQNPLKTNKIPAGAFCWHETLKKKIIKILANFFVVFIRIEHDVVFCIFLQIDEKNKFVYSFLLLGFECVILALLFFLPFGGYCFRVFRCV